MCIVQTLVLAQGDSFPWTVTLPVPEEGHVRIKRHGGFTRIGEGWGHWGVGVETYAIGLAQPECNIPVSHCRPSS
jgi:hypothetical protein